MTSPTPATHWVSGDAALYGGLFSLTNADPTNGDTSSALFGGLARANIWLSPTLSAQLDLSGESGRETLYDNTDTVFDLAGHLSYRDGPGHLVGVFGSVGYNNFYDDDLHIGTVGLEGQMYGGPILFYAQAGFSHTIGSGSGEAHDAFYVHGEGRYFYKPNLMIAANLGYARMNEPDESPAEPHDVWRWGADLEWKHDTMPIGAFLSYQGAADIEPNDTVDNFHTHTFLAGVKVYFNNETLQAQSDTGATLRNLNPYTGTNHVRFYDWN